MFHQVLRAGIAAGFIAGVVVTALQSGLVTPLIEAAETYEAGAGDPGLAAHRHGGPAHTHALGSSPHEHDGHAVILTNGGHGRAAASDGERSHSRTATPSNAGHSHAGTAGGADHHHGEAWAPEDGIERIVWTAVSNVATAIGFALLLGAIFAWRGGTTWRQGLVWGGAGFVVFFANPAIGLHPEIPGAFAAELPGRQLWWLFAVVCSGAGAGLLLLARKAAVKGAGAVLLAVPHLAGAPHPDVMGGLAPQALADQFVIATAITNGVFWLILGLAMAVAFGRFAQR